MISREEILNREVMNESWITPGCFVNYQLNQSCYCDYNGVCLQQLEAKEPWKQEEETNWNLASKNSWDKYT